MAGRATQVVRLVAIEATDPDTRVTQVRRLAAVIASTPTIRTTTVGRLVAVIEAATGSFTATASIVATNSGAVDAFAVLRGSGSGSITATAVIRKSNLDAISAASTIKASSGQIPLVADAHIVGNAITYEFSFTANASIGHLGEGSFTADARLAGIFTANAAIDPYWWQWSDIWFNEATAGGSFPANATLKATIGGSFTAVATVRKTITGLSFTANARIQKTTSNSFTANARVAGWFTADAHIGYPTIEGSFSASAVIKRTFAAPTLSADATLRKVIESSFTAQAVVVKGNFTADAVIKRTMTESPSIVFVDDFNRTVSEWEGFGGTWPDATSGGSQSAVNGNYGYVNVQEYQYWDNHPSIPTIDNFDLFVDILTENIDNPSLTWSQYLYLVYGRFGSLEYWTNYPSTNPYNVSITIGYGGVSDYISDSVSVTPQTWYRLHARSEWSGISVRFWPVAEEEPDEWLLSHSSSISGNAFEFELDGGHNLPSYIDNLIIWDRHPFEFHFLATVKRTWLDKTFSANANIVIPRFGSLRARAVIIPATYERFGSFYADAFVFGPWVSSFVADALIVGEVASHGGSFEAFAALSQTHRRSAFPADAVVKRTFSAPLWLMARIGLIEAEPVWSDDFERTTTQSLGVSSDGGVYEWANYHSVTGDELLENVYVDGHTAILPSAPSGGSNGYNWESFVGIPDLASARIQFDFWVPAAGTWDLFHPSFYIENSTQRFGVYANTVSTGKWGLWCGGEGTSSLFSVSSSTWYTAEFLYDATGYWQARAWPRTESRPGTATGSGTESVDFVSDYELPFLDFYYSAYGGADFKIDNLYIWEWSSGTGSFIANAFITRGSPVPGSFTADARISQGFFFANAVIGRWTNSFTADAVIKASFTKIWPLFADAYISKGYFTADASIVGLTETRVWWFPDLIATIKGNSGTKTFVADATIAYRFSFTADAFIQRYFTADAYISRPLVIEWDPEGKPIYSPPTYGSPYGQRIQIFVGETDITRHVVYSETTFTQQARVGAGTFRMTLRGAHPEFDGGEYVYVKIDDLLSFGGIVLQIESSYWFEDKAVPHTILMGTDFNILFDKLFLRNKDNPAEAAVYPKGITDKELIERVFDELLDLPAGFNAHDWVMNHEDDVVTVVSPDTPWMINGIQSLRSFMAEVTKITNAVFYIDPHLNLQYHSRGAVTAPAPITDGAGGISCRDLEITQDISNMYNDVFVWGALATSMEEIQNAYGVRRTRTESIEKYGLRQFAEVRSDLHVKAHVQKRANSIIARRNVVMTTGSCTILEPRFQAGQVVQVSAPSLDYTGTLVIREMQMRFPVVHESYDGKCYTTPMYDLQFGLQPEDPWNIYDMLPWDFSGFPHPFFSGMDALMIVDIYCPKPTLFGYVGDPGNGQWVVGWGAKSPSEGTLPWIIANHQFTESFVPYVQSDAKGVKYWELFYGYGYPGPAKFRLGDPAHPAFEILVEFALQSNDVLPGYAGISLSIGFEEFQTEEVLIKYLAEGTLSGEYGSEPSEPGATITASANQRLLLRVVHSGTWTFAKVWARNKKEPDLWQYALQTHGYGGDYIHVNPVASAYHVRLYGIDVWAQMTSLGTFQMVDGRSIQPEIRQFFFTLSPMSAGGRTSQYQWANVWAEDPPGFGWPYVGWTNTSPHGHIYDENPGVGPVAKAHCHYWQTGDPGDGSSGKIEEIQQTGPKLKVPVMANGTKPSLLRIYGTLSVGDRSGVAKSWLVVFAIRNDAPWYASSHWQVGNFIGSVAATGDWWPDETTPVPYSFSTDIPVDWMATWTKAGNNSHLFLIAYFMMDPEAVPTYAGFMDGGFMFPNDGWVTTDIDWEVECQWASVGGKFSIAGDPVHFCTMPEDGPSLEVSANEPPIWGWHSEYIVYDRSTGDFTLVTTAVRDFIAVYLQDYDIASNSLTARLMIPYIDYWHVSGKTYRMAGRHRGRVMNIVMARYLVLTSWLIHQQNVARPTLTDVVADGDRMPDLRGHM